MTLYLFKKMTPLNQLTALRMFGAYVASRRANNKWLFLYQIDAFYVEVLHDTSPPGVEIKRSFTSTNFLKPYLDKINLEVLLRDIQ